MPLSDLSSLITITGLDVGQTADWQLFDDELQSVSDGWDTWKVVFVKDYGTQRLNFSIPVTSQTVANEWPVGRRVFPGQDFWVRSGKPVQISLTAWRIELECAGRLPDKPLKFGIQSSDERWRQELPQNAATVVGDPYFSPPVTLNLPGTTQRVAALQRGTSLPVLTASYALIGALPQTERVGAAGAGFQTPPLDIGVTPPPPGVAPQTEIYLPYGWVMTSMDADTLAGTDVPASYVTETWSYILQRR